MKKKLLISILLVLFELTNLTGSFVYAQTGPTASSPSPSTFNASQSAVESPQASVTPVIPSLDNTPQSLSSAPIRIPIAIPRQPKHDFKANEDVSILINNPQEEHFTASVLDYKGKQAMLNITQGIDADHTAIKILRPHQFKPGKYTLEITDSSGETLTQDFTWGVLALNTNKSIYAPKEKADLALAVLDEKGNMVCDAQVTLTISSIRQGGAEKTDTLTTGNGKVTINPQCASHAFSLTPDYEAYYQLGDSGNYSMTLTAVTKAGTYTISDSIQVKESFPFVVERTSATRIYPPNDYPVNLKITANQDFKGTVTETVPDSFTITPSDKGISYDSLKTIYASSADDPETSLASLTATVSASDRQAVLAASTSALAIPFVGTYPITEGFGAMQTDPDLRAFYARYGLAGHDGVDFGLPTGTPILATDQGDILLAGPGDYGTTIIMQHAWGRSYYGHLSKVEVESGQYIIKGQEIGLSGSSGEATGPHLHFGIKPKNPDMNNGYSGKIDPLPYMGLAEPDVSSTSAVLGAATAAVVEKVKLLFWNVSVKKGDTLNLGYTYRAPRVSPQFYTLGPLTFYTGSGSAQTPVFEETRQWQIAADTPSSGTGNGVVIASLPRSTLTFTTEQVDGSDAHVAVIDAPNKLPGYKWQFLTGGLRLFIDRKDGTGWTQLVSQVQTAPEYLKQQGAAGNSVWNPYGLNITTNGTNVLQGYNLLDQADGSTKLIRTYATTEEGTPETLTETWTIPANAEDFAQKGPKVTYAMTKNRGIVTVKGVQEGTWRMRWQISGIADITADKPDNKDSTSWPIRRKAYGNGAFTVDVNDFNNSQTTPNFTYSELAAGKKAEILFFPSGTTGDRVIDPTVITANIATGWFHNHQRNIFFNGSNFFVFYTKGDSKIYYKAGANMTKLSGSAETSIITIGGNIEWDVFMVNDTKFDIAYADTTTTAKVQTCTISGTTVDCSTLKASASKACSQGGTLTKITLARTPSANRIWLITIGTQLCFFSADQTGDSGTSSASNVTSWTQESNVTQVGTLAMIPYHSSDKILWFIGQDNGGTNTDGIDSETCTRSAGCPTTNFWVIQQNWAALNDTHEGNGFWVSDTDFRYAYVDCGGAASNSSTCTSPTSLKEAKFDGTSTWSNLATIDSGGGQKNPSLFRDTQSGDEYAFYADSATPTSIQRYYKASGGSWGSKTDVDAGEGDNNSLPVTQMDDPPYGNSNNTESRSTPRDVPFCYLNVNTTNFDVVCDEREIAPGLDQLMRHGKYFDFQGTKRPFTF